ncbi:hypothetical protein QTP86_006198 [Hemibagrus guttatus]|nr:hypothetical protein QTP86_006198 [Hemibagrus guttatus]
MGLTPFQCMLGYQLPLFPWSGEPSDVPAVEEWYRRSQEVWERAHVRLQRAVCRQRIQADRRCRPHPSYQVGQKVWLSTRNLCLKLSCRKLSPKFIGPFEIIHQVNPVAYRLRLPVAYRIYPTFHVSLLKPAHPSAGGVTDGGEPPPLLDIEGTCSPGLQAGLITAPVARGLGGVRHRGAFMGGCRRYPGSFPHGGLPPRPPEQACSASEGMTIQDLQDELCTQRDLNELLQRENSAGSLGSPPDCFPYLELNKDNFHYLQTENEQQTKELFLLRKTLEEMELRMKKQKQTLSVRDESIKKLLEMLQEKGPTRSGLPDEDGLRVCRAEDMLGHLGDIQELKEKENKHLITKNQTIYELDQVQEQINMHFEKLL